MKKNGILNSHISKVLADLGHTDTIVVSDVGLPVPEGVTKIDLALKLGVPSFKEVLAELAADMVVEKITIASEMECDNPEALDDIRTTFSGCTIEACAHEDFKQKTRSAKVVIRTGEAKPYANCILQAGVHFG
ncbi:D-ribose pyranase [Paenibacillus sp. JX-17]|uniref:D-ribose pyranase n=1 Tax=Paenibacillus lacisoli TaxID=3064525 RepID=A0ABT9C8M0_9BACL|nr:D-ribose pyranase [Paenibacillus sp. JX-17]MDO7905594.1 D-ribose pyranase [Paenibacillus sp. JX-17]